MALLISLKRKKKKRRAGHRAVRWRLVDSLCSGGDGLVDERGCDLQLRQDAREGSRYERALHVVCVGPPGRGSDLIGFSITTHCHALPRITTHYHARTTTHYHALLPRTTTHYQKPKHYPIKSDPQAPGLWPPAPGPSLGPWEARRFSVLWPMAFEVRTAATSKVRSGPIGTQGQQLAR
jgi:hypothetical protein